MNPKPRLDLSALVTACSLAATTLGAAAAPNVVVILADDIGAHELGVYGHPTHQTPHLDQLARGGIYFNTAYALPVCHPSRHALMTGQYPHHNGVFHFPNRAGGPPVENEGDDNIAAHLTFGRLFQQAGYATAMAGKWQLSGELPSLVRETGFDEYSIWAYDHNLPAGVTHTGGREPHSGRTSRYWHPSILQNGAYRPTTIDEYGPDLFTDFLIDFTRRNQAKANKPFFLYYSMALTHEPYYPTPDSLTSPDDKFKRSNGNWRANVEYMDKLVGRLLAALEASGQRENTLIVFLGDNGTALNGKGETSEMGARVPLIINGPGLVKSRGLSPELADITDILPTICEVAGISLPPGQLIDGISLAPYLRGEIQPLRDWIYAPLGGRRTLRTKRWLLENNTPWAFGQLYDCGDARDGTGYRNVTALDTPEVHTARAELRAIMRELPVPDVTPDDARMIGREKPHYVARTDRHGLNSPVIIPVGGEAATLTVYPSLAAASETAFIVLYQAADSAIAAKDVAGLVQPLNEAGNVVGVLRGMSGDDGAVTDGTVMAALTLVRERAAEFAVNGPIVSQTFSEAGVPVATLSAP
jgi:arylsulfatase A